MPIADLRSCVAVWLNWLIDVGPPGAALAPPIKYINVLCTYKSFVPFRRVLENVKDVRKGEFYVSQIQTRLCCVGEGATISCFT